MINVLIVDDHTLLRDGIKAVLKSDPEINIIGEGSNGEEAVELAKSLKPDVIVLDVNLPKIKGTEAAKRIRENDPNVKILILTMYDDEDVVTDAVSAGVNGFMLKMADMEEFLKAVHTIAEGNEYYGERISQLILNSFKSKILKENDRKKIEKALLTKREKEILVLIAGGLTSQEIADKLFISYFTVGEHRKKIMSKLGLKNLADLIHYVTKEGLI